MKIRVELAHYYYTKEDIQIYLESLHQGSHRIWFVEPRDLEVVDDMVAVYIDLEGTHFDEIGGDFEIHEIPPLHLNRR